MPKTKTRVRTTSKKKVTSVTARRTARKLETARTRRAKTEQEPTTAKRARSTNPKEAPKPADRRGKAQAVPYVIKEDYLQLTIGDQPFTLDSTHPTFVKLKRALQGKRWKAVPRLVNLAQSLVMASKGNVEVKSGVVYYKGTPVHSSLTTRILDLVNHQKDVEPMMLFMNNLYRNPSKPAVNEFYDWLVNNDLPITDDGCFIAYKSVDEHLKDQHTHTIDNSPGQVIMMTRGAADENYRQQCSYGFHVCSKQYGLYGSRVMAVKVNPRDVLAANGGKMRVLKYEVIKELGRKGTDGDDALFKAEGFASIEKKLIVEVKAEKKGLLALLLKAAPIKRLFAADKLKESTLKKYPLARIVMMAQKYNLVPEQNMATEVEGMQELEGARRAAGFTVGQVAKQMGLNYTAVARLEKDPDPRRDSFDAYIKAVASIKGVNLRRSAVSFPVPTPAR